MRLVTDCRPPRGLDPTLAERWRCLLRDQEGLLTTAQLAELDVGQGAITANVRAGRWRRVLPRVLTTYTGPLPRSAAIVATLLYAGPTALLSHRTAAEEWRMLPVEDGTVHVTVPYGCSAVSQPPLVAVHRSRAFRHVAVHTEPPRTARADTVLDLAAAEPDARSAMRQFVALATRGRVPVRELRERMELRPPRRHRSAIHEALRLLSDGVQSALEQRYACDVELAHGLPRAVRQAPVVVDGRTLWEDTGYDHIGVALTVRLDGRAFHDAPEITFRDRRRDNAAEVAGRHRLTYGWRETTEDSCGVAAEVAGVLYRAGWHGPLRSCGHPSCEWQMQL